MDKNKDSLGGVWRAPRAAVVGLFASALLGVGLVGGCAETVRTSGSGVFVGNQGGAWEAVLGGADAEYPSGSPEAYEFSRADGRLGVGAVQEQAEAAAWPTYEELPTLENARRLNIRSASETVIYFRRDRTRQRITVE
ncbi:MAG: hypothetical protein ACKVW3_14720 [Phycisphaerales bacterium]